MQLESYAPYTLPQYQSTEEAWLHAGPEFQQGQTRFRTYGNEFDAGVVLPEYVGPRPLSAPTHITTNTKPPDIRVDDNDAVPLRTVAFATAGFHPYQFWKTRGGLKLEKRLGPGVVAPPRRARLLGDSSRVEEKLECELRTVQFPARETDLENPEPHAPLGSSKVESASTISFPSTGRDKESEPPESHKFSLVHMFR